MPISIVCYAEVDVECAAPFGRPLTYQKPWLRSSDKRLVLILIANYLKRYVQSQDCDTMPKTTLSEEFRT